MVGNIINIQCSISELFNRNLHGLYININTKNLFLLALPPSFRPWSGHFLDNFSLDHGDIHHAFIKKAGVTLKLCMQKTTLHLIL